MSQDYKIADYLTGRDRVPPWFNALKQKPYTYQAQVSVANNGQGVAQINIQADSYFLAESLTITPSTFDGYELAQVQITDTSLGQPWSNAPINLRDIAGRGNNQMIFTVPNLVRPSSTINFLILNAMGETNQFYITLQGQKVYGLTDLQVATLMRRMWFQYKLSLPAVAAGATGQISSVNIFNESDFLCKKLWGTTIAQFVINAATAGAVSTELMGNLRDQTSDNSFFSGQTALRLVTGSLWSAYRNGGASFNNGDAFRFRRPFLIRRNGQVQGTFDNLSATNLDANVASIVMDGIRIFDPIV